MGTFGNITSDSRQCAFPGGSTDIQTMALGGTGANLTAIAGGVVYSTATQLAITAAGTSTQVLHGNGVGAPTWGAVALTTDVSGVLPVANGGTNKSSWTDGGVVFAGPAGATLEQTATTFFWDYVLGRLGIGNNTPQVLLDLGLAGTTAGVMRLAGLTSGNVTIQPAAAAGTWTLTLPITDGAANEFLKTDGAGVTSWSSVVLTTDVSGTLPVGNGGSGATTLTGVLYGNGAAAFTASVGTANYLPKWSATAPYLTGTSLIYDNGTNVGINTITPLKPLDVAGGGRFTGTASSTITGTADPTASTTLVGTGTLFLTELVRGDRITVNAETRTVTAIASDTSLTVDTAFTDTAGGASITRLPAILIGRLSSGAVGVVVNDLGTLVVGDITAANGDINLTRNSSGTTVEIAQVGTGKIIELWDGVIGSGVSVFAVLDGGNFGFNTTAFGTSAAKVMAIGNGTAPSTSPADVVQMWSADRGGTAGKASLHIRTEDGTSHVFGDNSGIGTTTPDVRLDVRGSGNDLSSAAIQIRSLASLGNTSAGAILTVRSIDASGYVAAYPSDYSVTEIQDRVLVGASSDASGITLYAPGASQDIRFFAGSTVEKARITSSGSVGIGATTLNASAKLQIDSTTQGLLPPRMTKAQRDAIGTPANGLMIYQTDGNVGPKAYVAGAWNTLNLTADP